MKKRMVSLCIIMTMVVSMLPAYVGAAEGGVMSFSFGASGDVKANDEYTDEKGYGFAEISDITDEDSDVTGSSDYTFKVKLDNGNYTVNVNTTADSITSEVVEAVTATTGITKTGSEFNVAVCDGVLDLTFPSGSTLSSVSVAAMETKEQRTKPAVYTIGDSTTNNKNTTLGTKSWGNCVSDGDITLPSAFSSFQNNARSGRDSLKYYNEGYLEKTLLDLCPGDYVTVNMGINSSAEEWLAFQTLMSEYYVQAILDRGGIPVIVTATPAGPVGNFMNAEYNSETGKFTNNRGDSCRNDVLRKIAHKKQLNIIELGKHFEDYFNSLTMDDVTEYNTVNGTTYTTVLELVQSWYVDHNLYTQPLGEKIGAYITESLAAIAAGSEDFSYKNVISNNFYEQNYENETDASLWSAMVDTSDYLKLITDDSTYGKYISYDLAGYTNINPRTSYTGFSADTTDEDFYVMEFDMALNGNKFMVTNTDFVYNESRTIYSSPNYIFDMSYADESSWVLNGIESNTVTLTKGEWYHYKLVVDKENKRLTATITDGDGTAVIENKLCPISAENMDAAGLFFLSGRRNSSSESQSIKVDNILIREKTEDDLLGDTSDEAINTVSFSDELNKKILIAAGSEPQHHKIALDIEGIYGTDLNQSADVEWSIVGAEKFTDSISLTTEAGTGDGLSGDDPSGNTAYMNITDAAAGCIGYVRAVVNYNGDTRIVKTPFAVYDETENQGYIAPNECYPVNMSDYADSLVGYVSDALDYKEGDIILGNWSVYGSNPDRKLELKADNDRLKYMSFTSNNTQSRPTVAVYPLANQDSGYTVDMTVRFSGEQYTLGHFVRTPNFGDTCNPSWTLYYDNGVLTAGEQSINNLNNGEWYRIKITADESISSYNVYAYNTEGEEIGQITEEPLLDTASSDQQYFCVYYSATDLNAYFDISSFSVYEASYVKSGECGDNLNWELKDDGTLEITGKGRMDDYSDSAAPWYALRNQITSISIQGASSIGWGAFNGLTKITNIDIPLTVTEIDGNAFLGCSSLESITIPLSVTGIGGDVFDGCNENLVINGYSNSAAESYANEYGITFNAIDTDDELIAEGEINEVKWTVTSDGILKIGVKDNAGVFEDYIGLDDFEQGGAPWYEYRNDINSIIIKDKMFTIGDYAFEGMQNLQYVSMPREMSFISDKAFDGSKPELISGYANSAAQDYALDNDITFSSCGNKTVQSSWSGQTTTDFDENNDPICIAYEFWTNGKLVLSDEGNIQSYNMDDYHFPIIVNSITIEDGPKLIDYEAFKDFHFISEVTVPSSVIRIEDGAFKNCTRLKAVTIPYTTMTIGENVFDGCDEKLVIKGYTNSAAEKYAKKNNIKFESIGTAPRVTVASGECSDNITWTLDSYGLLTISGEGDMEQTSTGELPWYSYIDLISRIVVEDGITSVAPYAFANAVNVTDVSLPDTVTAINGNAFNNCKSLTSIEIPSGVNTLGSRCFKDCTSLKTAVIPYQVTSIEDNSFEGHSEELTIKGYEHSSAEKYADENEIQFESIGVMPNEIIASGSAGDNITWTLDNYGLLNITGSGKMSKNAFSDLYYFNRSRIYKINMSDGITSISDGAFKELYKCSEVKLSKDLKTIGSNAFANCSSLKNITIPDGVTKIDPYAFAGCNNLEAIVIPDGVTTVESGVFRQCSSLVNVKLGANTKLIGNYAFYGCSSLGSITLPEGLTNITQWSFAGTGLREIVLPDSVTCIDQGAFRGTYITEINIGTNVQRVSPTALNCGGLTQINVAEANPYYSSSDGVLFNKDKTEIVCYPCGRTEKTYNIPSTVTVIGNSAFSGCRVEKVTIPRGAASILNGAFYECDYLTEVIIPNTVTYIGDEVFTGCTELKKISYIGTAEQWYNIEIIEEADSFPQRLVEFSYTPDIKESNIEWTLENGVLTISGEGHMDDYTTDLDTPWGHSRDIRSVVVEEGITGIGDYAFYQCQGITSVSLPEGLEYIGRGAFSYNLFSEITLPESLKYIGAQAFRRNTALSSINIPSNVAFIGERAFDSCLGLAAITVSANNSNYRSENNVLFGRDVYDGTTILIQYPFGGEASYTVPDGVTTIGGGAFAYSDIEKITFNDDLEEIDDSAFEGCGKLKSLTLPDSLYYIGEYAFRDVGMSGERRKNDQGEWEYTTSYNIDTITIPENVSEIGSGAFTCLQSIQVDARNSWYKSVDGVLFSKDGKELIAYPSRKVAESYTIPNTVTRIESRAFADADIKNIVMPDSVTAMGIRVFVGSPIESVRLSKNLTGINDYTFCQCSRLQTVEIPDGVTSIGTDAFRRCLNLTGVTIPLSVTGIGSNAFSECNALTDIYYGGTASYWRHNISKSGTGADPTKANSNVQLHCEKITSGKCGNNLTWSVNEEGILTISGKGKMIVEDANNQPWKAAADDVKAVVIEEGVTSIADRAFSVCENLEAISIPSTVTEIGELFTMNCPKLSQITVAANSRSFKTDEDGVLFTYDGKTLMRYPAANDNTAYTVSDDVEKIWGGAFSHSNLQYVYGMEHVSYLGCYTFYYCKELQEIDMPSITEIDDYMFMGCKSLESIDLPEGLKRIGKTSFEYCYSLTSVEIPEGVESIGDYAFNSCTQLEKITIPDTVSYMGKYSLAFCENMRSIKLPASLTEISNGLCYGNAVSAVQIPEGITKIGQSAFYKCTDLVSAELPTTVTEIGNYAFWGCSSLISADIPDGVTNLSKNLFCRCNSLRNVSIPESVEYIDDYAFRGCYNLERVSYKGDSSSFESMLRDMSCVDNECLMLSGIECKTSDLPAPQIISPVVMNNGNGTYTVTTRFSNIPYRCRIMAVGCNGDVMKGIGSQWIKPVDSGAEITINAESVDEIKIFIWDSISNMKPLCQAVPIESDHFQTGGI